MTMELNLSRGKAIAPLYGANVGEPSGRMVVVVKKAKIGATKFLRSKLRSKERQQVKTQQQQPIGFRLKPAQKDWGGKKITERIVPKKFGLFGVLEKKAKAQKRQLLGKGKAETATSHRPEWNNDTRVMDGVLDAKLRRGLKEAQAPSTQRFNRLKRVYSPVAKPARPPPIVSPRFHLHVDKKRRSTELCFLPKGPTAEKKKNDGTVDASVAPIRLKSLNELQNLPSQRVSPVKVLSSASPKEVLSPPRNSSRVSSQLLRDLFSTIDKDHLGFVNASQIFDALDVVGLSATLEQISDFIYIVNDGQAETVEYDEFEVFINALLSTADNAYSIEQLSRTIENHSKISLLPPPAIVPQKSSFDPFKHTTHHSLSSIPDGVGQIGKANSVNNATKEKISVNPPPTLTSSSRFFDTSAKSGFTCHGKEMVRDNMTELCSMLLEDVLQDAARDLTLDEIRDREAKIAPKSHSIYENMLLTLEKMENQENMLFQHVYGTSYSQQSDHEMRQLNKTSKETPRQLQMYLPRKPTPLPGVPLHVIDNIKAQKTRFEKHRKIIEASLAQTGFKQADVIEIIEDALTDHIIHDCMEELEELFSLYAQKLFNTL